ncbi:MAG: hypothetical protein COB83_07215 [Gammaproteobacteria bacterium]|nr:MAG: hypothetical protein COB83_07215 [Gammaproteobacteria bacterium]
MATLLITGVDENTFLNVYNNNVAEVVFENIIPEVLNYMRVTIVNGSQTVILQVTYFPDVAGEYELKFNLKDPFKSLMTDIKNNDSGVPNQQVFFDDDLLQTYDVEYGFIYPEPEDNLYYDFEYKAFKSVEQIGKTISKPITDPYILNKSDLTFFKGYPFDFSIYSNSSIALRNLNNGNYILYGGVTTGVNRVYLSRGLYLLDALDIATDFKARIISIGGTLYDNPCYIFDSEPILRTGYNNLKVELGSFDPKTLNIKLIDACEGIYLKWLNEEGSWSYWLFNSIHTDDIKSKVLDIYSTDFESITETYFPSLITGKDAKNILNLSYNGLDNNEYEQLKSIVTAPRVELFIGEKDDDYSRIVANGGDDYTKAWMSVRVLDGTITKSTKIGIHDIKISIDKNQYTQS